MEPTHLPSPFSSSRAWYSAPIAEFLRTQPESVLGQLAASNDFALIPTQRDTWIAQIEILRSHLVGLSGSLFLEFNIPRMGRRSMLSLLLGRLSL